MRKLRGTSSVGLMLLLAVVLVMAYSLGGGFKHPSYTTLETPTNDQPVQTQQQTGSITQSISITVTAMQSQYQALQAEVQNQAALPQSAQSMSQMQILEQQLVQDISTLQIQYQTLQGQVPSTASPTIQSAVQTFGQNLTAASTGVHTLQNESTTASSTPSILQSTQFQSTVQSLGQNITALSSSSQQLQTLIP